MYEQELPSLLDDFPNYQLKLTAETDKTHYDEEEKKQLVRKYLQTLEKNLRQKISSPQQKQQALDISLDLFDQQFNKLYCHSLFKDTTIPLSEKLEEIYGEDYDTIIKLIYNEGCYRHAFQKVYQTFNLKAAIESWNNYQLLFQFFQNKAYADIPLPPTWIWDILDEYVYQFYLCSRWRKSLKQEELIQIKGVTSFWNLQEVVETLEQFYSLRKPNPSTMVDIVAHYSYLAMIKIHVMGAHYQDALKMIDQITYDDLMVFSKAGGAYQSLFSFAGFSYLMTKQYRKAHLTLSLIVNYFHKHKQLYTKSFQYEGLIKQHEKILSLLAIAQIFYPELDDNTITIMKESKQKVFEKFEKIQRNEQCVSELFLQSCPKILCTLFNMEEFELIHDFNVNDLLMEQKERIVRDYQNIRKVNDVESILKLYNKINVEHFNKIIPNQFVEQYLKRNEAILNNDSLFEQKVLNKYWVDSKLLKIEIQNQVIHVKEVPVNNRDFINQMTQLNINLEKGLSELIKVV